ncbi:MAG: hypothetical protein GX348_04910 [Veillonellaceae bacterium]|jgi:hypothetical protein|nr:hypothetical protein [Veillonellaceae bacterium]
MLEKPFEMDEIVVDNLLKTYNNSRIYYAIEYVKNMKNVNHYPSYLYRSIERNYGQQWADAQFSKSKKKREAKEKAAEIERKLREDLDKEIDLINSKSDPAAFLELYKSRKQTAAVKHAEAPTKSFVPTKEMLLEMLSLTKDGPAKDRLIETYGYLLK